MTVNSKTKPQYKTEKVVKDDGTVVQIRRCNLKDLDLLLEIQDRLLKRYVEEEGALGKLMSDEAVRSDLTTACSLLPLADKTKTGEDQYLDFEDIQDNWEQLVVLFFNGSFDEDTRTSPTLLPSKVSNLHFFPYLEMLRTHLKEIEKNQEEG